MATKGQKLVIELVEEALVSMQIFQRENLYTKFLLKIWLRRKV